MSRKVSTTGVFKLTWKYQSFLLQLLCKTHAPASAKEEDIFKFATIFQLI